MVYWRVMMGNIRTIENIARSKWWGTFSISRFIQLHLWLKLGTKFEIIWATKVKTQPTKISIWIKIGKKKRNPAELDHYFRILNLLNHSALLYPRFNYHQIKWFCDFELGRFPKGNRTKIASIVQVTKLVMVSSWL